jgi:DNA-binding XRE family transcriptional regulator
MNSEKIKKTIITVEVCQQDSLEMMADVALSLKSMRKQCGLSVTKVAKMIEMSRTHLNNIEGCRSNLSTNLANKLLTIYENELGSKKQ